MVIPEDIGPGPLALRRTDRSDLRQVTFYFDCDGRSRSGAVSYDALSGIDLLGLQPLAAFDREGERILEVARAKLRRGEGDPMYQSGGFARLSIDDLPLNYALLDKSTI